MTLDCIHFRGCGLQGGGCCDAGHYGGSVSYGVCVNVCPHRTAGKAHDVPEPAGRPAGQSVVTLGRAKWAWLHERLAAPIRIEDRPAVWQEIKALADGLALCGCKRHWQTVLAARPVDWNDPAAWAVKAHNDVNEKLGRPKWTPPV